jgi:hypothetical protein
VRKYSRSELIQAASRFERFLCALGVHPTVAGQLIGDLEESYHECAERFGAGAARRDYARQFMRSMPHLAVNAWENGNTVQRARLVLLGAAVITISASTTSAANRARLGPPAEIFAEHATASLIVVNNSKAALLPMRVVDSRGHELDKKRVEYRWLSGIPMLVSPQGEVTCLESGDAKVRASVGDVASTVTVRCRPVAKIEAATWITLIEGGADQELPFTAIGMDEQPVTELRGSLRVKDSTIATLSGVAIRPVSVGETEVVVTIGDVATRIRVLVHERVTSLTGLRPDQKLVAIPIRLARGDTVRFSLPVGVYWLKYLPSRPGEAPPSIFTAVTCGSGDGIRVNRVPHDEYAYYCMIMNGDAAITFGHGLAGKDVVMGTLAIDRVADRW